jgi:hypothetical protein
MRWGKRCNNRDGQSGEIPILALDGRAYPKRVTEHSARKTHSFNAAPMSIEELEAGLRIMDKSGFGLQSFWDANVIAFRQTVLLAIRDTTDVLLASSTPLNWRAELESQLDDLVGYVELADRYIARRSLSCEQPVPAPRSQSSRLH